MRPHTTHHDDCGCLSERYERRIEALRTALTDLRRHYALVGGPLVEHSTVIHMIDRALAADDAAKDEMDPHTRAVFDLRARLEAAEREADEARDAYRIVCRENKEHVAALRKANRRVEELERLAFAVADGLERGQFGIHLSKCACSLCALAAALVKEEGK